MTGNQLRLEIKKLDITQDTAAKKLGISRVTLGRWFDLPALDANKIQIVNDRLGIEVYVGAEKPLSETEMMKYLLDSNNTLTETNSQLTQKIIELIDELNIERKKTNNAVAEPARTANAG